MRDKLNTAITDIKRMEQTAEPEQSSKGRWLQYCLPCCSFILGYTLTVADTLKRNTQINQIEEAGFTPAAFISKRGGKKDQIEVLRACSVKFYSSLQQKHDDHESAVFGPMWKSKELAKKLEKQEKKPVVQLDLNSIPMPSEVDTNFDDFPLAKQWVSFSSVRSILSFSVRHQPRRT